MAGVSVTKTYFNSRESQRGWRFCLIRVIESSRQITQATPDKANETSTQAHLTVGKVVQLGKAICPQQLSKVISLLVWFNRDRTMLTVPADKSNEGNKPLKIVQRIAIDISSGLCTGIQGITSSQYN